MNTDNLENREQIVLELFNDKKYRPMKLKEIAMMLDVTKEHRQELKDVLDKLEAEGKITVSSNGRYKNPLKELVTGKFISNPRGFGFVECEDRDEDIFISPDNVNGAFPDDVVQAAITGKKDGGREEGRIVKIVEHNLKTVVGLYQKNKKFGFVIPDNQRITRDFFIPKGRDMDAANGQKVVAEITDYGNDHKNPEARIVEILGNRSTAGVDILSIVRAYDIPEEFPDEVLAQINQIPDKVSAKDAAGRRDIRGLKTVTIDGEDAKDLDDAVTLTFDGVYHLGVHIADVTNYVKEGSPLDKEAVKRGTSVYLVDRVIPMLPKKLSNGICSLNEGEDRLALSCFMDIDTEGNVIGHEIVETLINVDHRMSYPVVADIINTGECPAEYLDCRDDFMLMAKLSKLLRKKRFQRGAIDFDFPEAKIILDEKGRPVEIKPYERSAATQLIEDFMLITNETIAEEYFWLELPFVYRVHETPDIEKMHTFAAFINNFGYSLHIGAGSSVYPKELQKILEKVEGSEEEALISRVLLRSLRQARYSPENAGHFGLSAKYYCHFTSPIRRYPDLQIHRIIKENLHGGISDKRKAHYDKLLPEVCSLSSALERRADEAEREVEKMKKAQYMLKHIGEVYEGVISGVTAYGMYVELPNTVEGMVRAANMSDDYYIYRQESYSLIGEMTGKTYSIGQRVKVVVCDADMLTKTIEFLLYNEFGDGGNSNGKRKRKANSK